VLDLDSGRDALAVVMPLAFVDLEVENKIARNEDRFAWHDYLQIEFR
jgi:hypothetical protein